MDWQLFRVWVKYGEDEWEKYSSWCTEGGACAKVEELCFPQDDDERELTGIKVTNAIDEWVYKADQRASNDTEIPGECFGSFGLLDWG